jgi:antitoxin ParD1/3/4
MATVTISLPEPMKEWIEARIKEGEYASTSGYIRDLVHRDRERRSRSELTIDDLRRIVEESRASGVGEKSVSDILTQAKKHAKGKRPFE